MEKLHEAFVNGLTSGAVGEFYRNLERLYGRVRPHLPRRGRVRYNSVEVAVHRRPLDILFPNVAWRARDQPKYDSGPVDAVRSNVTEGDVVVVVGGGFGVTTVAAARRAGESGRILTYEAAEQRVEDVRKAAAYDGVSDRVSVLHAVVHRVIKPLGDVGDAPTVPGRALPPCDVLVLDCDGPEVEVLRDLAVEPRVIVANTAGRFDSSETDVRNALADLGYRVVTRGVMNEESPEFCHENGYYSLTAVREDREKGRASDAEEETGGDRPPEHAAPRSR